MEWKLFATVFLTVFIAELGDKTQLATMLFAADREVSRLTVFLGASLALVASSAIGVAAGALVVVASRNAEAYWSEFGRCCAPESS